MTEIRLPPRRRHVVIPAKTGIHFYQPLCEQWIPARRDDGVDTCGAAFAFDAVQPTPVQGFDGAAQNLTRDDSRLKNDSFDTPTATPATGAAADA